MKLWFRAIWHVVGQKTGVNALGLQKELGLGSYHTAWNWLHKLRYAMVRPGRDALSGTIEVDDAYLGSPKLSSKKLRQPMDKAVLLIAVERDNGRIGRIRLCQIPNANTATMNKVIPTIIEPGSTVITDGWSGYQELQSLGYKHKVLTYKQEGKENLLPGANLIVSLLRRWLMGTHQGAVRRSHLDYYLDEFVFRFNRRKSQARGKLFYRMIQQAVQIAPLLNKNISKRAKIG